MKLLVLAFIVSSVSHALPGFLPRLKALHPDKKDCLACHQSKPPSAKNVKDEGRKFYEELLAQDGKNVKIARAVLSTPSPDFIIYGDSRDNPKVQKALVEEFCKQNVKAVYHTGDIVGSGSVASQWKDALEQVDCLVKAKKIFFSCGNHEGRYCTDNVLRRTLGNTDAYYLHKQGEFTFIALDSNNKTAAQQKWLSELPVGPNYIPFFHHPPYPTMAGHSADKEVVNKWVPQFTRLGIKLVFSGHNHGYDRAVVDGVQYVTQGGGGAPLYPCGTEHSYTQACMSDYGYTRCGFSGLKVDCESRRLKDDAIVDSFSVDYAKE